MGARVDALTDAAHRKSIDPAVGLLCRRREVADRHVFDHTPAERADFSHRKLLSGEGGSDNPSLSDRVPQGTLSPKSAASNYRGAVSFNLHL